MEEYDIGDNNLKHQVSNISYADIFGTLERQVKSIEVQKLVFKVWKLKLEAENLFHSVDLNRARAGVNIGSRASYIVKMNRNLVQHLRIPENLRRRTNGIF